MTMEPDDFSETERRLFAAIADYYAAVQRGEAPTPEELLGRHPDLAEKITEFFAAQERFDRAIEPLRRAGGSGSAPDTTDPHDDERDAVPGSLVGYFGDYEIIEEIARGGMGIVYRARQISLGRPVALKMILAGTLASAEDVSRFRKEAEAVANLDHPHVVPIYEVGAHAGRHYFSMKLI